MAQGKTVVAITHDDRYFALADRVVKLEAGRIVSDTRRRDPGFDRVVGGTPADHRMR